MSQGVTTGLFALGGVLIGGLLNVATGWWLDKRRDDVAIRAAVRLVRNELASTISMAQIQLDTAVDYDTPPRHGHDAAENYEVKQWEIHHPLLASHLPPDQWQRISSAYHSVQSARSYFGVALPEKTDDDGMTDDDRKRILGLLAQGDIHMHRNTIDQMQGGLDALPEL